MDFRDFLSLAGTLASGSTEADWRSSVSRAYYAAFHVAVDLLTGLGFAVPKGDRAHAFGWLRLSNAGHPNVVGAGQNLNHLRSKRNQADYDSRARLTPVDAARFRQMAIDVIAALDAARADPTRSQITSAMIVYERDVLKTVTWRPAP